MDNEDELYFQQQLQEYEQQYLKEIAEDCLEIFKQSIDEAVYQSYSPSWYSRTRQLFDNCEYKIKDNSLYIYVDVDTMTYHSWISFQDTGREVASIVPYLVEVGHTDSSGIDNMYHDFPATYYLERAKSKILLKYGFDVEIINDKPGII